MKHTRKICMSSDFSLRTGFKGLIFMLELLWIIGTEFIYDYFLYRNRVFMIKKLSRRLASVNILYVKLFQALALNQEWIDHSLNTELLEFTDHAPFYLSEINYGLVNQLVEQQNLELLNNRLPINSGMISIVFKAMDKSSHEIFIIKTKRKNIDAKLNEAIDDILCLLRLLSLPFPPFTLLREYKIHDLVKQNIEIILQQTNFQTEVQNMMTMKKFCKNLAYVVIPDVFPEVTMKYPDLILMKYIEGKKINEVRAEDYEGYARSVLKFGFVSTFIHGITHGDLHSGNILFLPDHPEDKEEVVVATEPSRSYRIGLIDFGLLHRLDTEFKEKWLECLMDITERPIEESALAILYSGIFEPMEVIHTLHEDVKKKWVNLIAEFLRPILHEKHLANSADSVEDITSGDQGKGSGGANQILLYEFLRGFDDFLKKNQLISYGLRVSNEYIKIQLVIAMAHGITMQLCGDRYVSLADDVLMKLFKIE